MSGNKVRPESVTALRDEGEDLLARLAHVLEQLEAERRIETQLQEFPVQGSLTLVDWGRQSERAKQMAAAVRERADEDLRRQDRQGGSHSSLVRRDVASLVAAVRVVLEGPEGRGPVNTFVSGDRRGMRTAAQTGGRRSEPPSSIAASVIAPTDLRNCASAGVQ